MKPTDNHEYDMGYTPAEFKKVLEGGFSDARSPYQVDQQENQRWRITDAQGLTVDLTITANPARKLGLLELPSLAVKFDFIDTETTAKSMLFDRFFKYFHKGGG